MFKVIPIKSRHENPRLSSRAASQFLSVYLYVILSILHYVLLDSFAIAMLVPKCLIPLQYCKGGM